jgi:hypothetical protein
VPRQTQAILDGPLEDVLSVLIDPSARAARLRRSAPFAGVLTEDERLAIFKA